MSTGRGNAPADRWAEIRRRMQAVQDTLERGLAPGPEAQARVLKARAAALAREPRAEPAGSAIDVVEFLLAHETYAFELRQVREVLPLRALTPLPGAPAFALGITSVRGSILSIVDLREFFGLPRKGLTQLNRVIVLAGPQLEFGVLADEVKGTATLPRAALQPAPPTLTGIRAEYLAGVTVERTVVLDAARLLADPRFIVRQENGG